MIFIIVIGHSICPTTRIMHTSWFQGLTQCSPTFRVLIQNCMKKEQLTDEQKCANSKLKINYSNKADVAHACSSYTDVCFTITAHTHASTSKGTFLFFSFENKLCVPHLGMLSRSSLTNSPSRLASRLHVTRASHVHGSDSSSSSSSSLSNHFWRTARMKSSWSWCFLHSFLTVGLSASSLYAKSSHCVGSCEVIQCMILRLPLEPSLFFILISSFIVGLEADMVITMYVRIKITSLFVIMHALVQVCSWIPCIDTGKFHYCWESAHLIWPFNWC